MKKKIAILLPMFYEGGTLRLTLNLAKMLHQEAERSGKYEIVFGNIEGRYDLDLHLSELVKAGMKIRSFTMKEISGDEVKELSHLLPGKLVGHTDKFMIPYDGGINFLDCDLWLFPVDRILGVLLPLKKSVIFATDYIQRYVPGIFDTESFGKRSSILFSILRNMRNVDRAIAYTPGTYDDLISYAGCSNADFIDVVYDADFLDPKADRGTSPIQGEYFIWVTNGTLHKNHKRTLAGLEKFFIESKSNLKVVVTGVQTNTFEPSREGTGVGHADHPYHREIRSQIVRSGALKDRLIIKGNVSDVEYAKLLSHAKFLLHSVIADNGTYSVIEASTLGVPVLSSRYPQQEYLNECFGLDMTFFDPFSVDELSEKLTLMANNTPKANVNFATIEARKWQNLAPRYMQKMEEIINEPRRSRIIYT